MTEAENDKVPLQNGVLRVSETVESEIEAAQAIVVISVMSEKLVFGNAALAASEDLKTIIHKVKQVHAAVDVVTESVSLETHSGRFVKNSTSTYTVKLTVHDISLLGEILGICSEGKRVNVQSLQWHFEEEEEKLRLIKQAVQKAKQKADQMMDVIDYAVVGMRSCSDSYNIPLIHEVHMMPRPSPAASPARARSASPEVDIGTQFQSKKKISATCTAEFLVRAKA